MHMMHLLRLRRRPSAAMVVAIIALVVAASGTAVAATNLTSGDSLIAKHSLSGNRLRNHTVSGQQIKLGSLGTVPSAAHASTADSATSATSATNATNATNATTATTAGSAPISKITYVANTVTIPAGSGPVLASVSCPPGTNVTGGGASVSDQMNGYVNDTYPNGKTGWSADIVGTGITATVTAICAPAAATAP
jgi:hypothetical protein